MNKGIYFAAFTALLWGFLPIAVKVALNDLSPYSVSWARFVIAFAGLASYYLFFDKKKFKILLKPPKFAIFAGIALGFNYLGFITGIHHTSPTITQVFIQTGPVLLAIAGFAIFKEKVSYRQGFGLLVVILGLLVFYNEQLINITGSISQYRSGVLFVLFGAVMWALYAVFQKVAVKVGDPMQLNLIIFGIPAIAYAPFVEFHQLVSLETSDYLILLFLGLNTLGAYGSLAYALKYLEANKISVIITMNPLITFVVMAIVSKNQVSWIQSETYTVITILGAIIVLTGVVLTVFKKSKNPKN